jgi:hypothetical protein
LHSRPEPVSIAATAKAGCTNFMATVFKDLSLILVDGRKKSTPGGSLQGIEISALGRNVIRTIYNGFAMVPQPICCWR